MGVTQHGMIDRTNAISELSSDERQVNFVIWYFLVKSRLTPRAATVLGGQSMVRYHSG